MRKASQKTVYVSCKWYFPDGGGRNYIATPSLAKAIRMNKKLKRNARQIDVRVREIESPTYYTIVGYRRQG